MATPAPAAAPAAASASAAPAAAAQAVGSLRALMAKLPGLAQPMPVKMQLIATMTQRTVAAAVATMGNAPAASDPAAAAPASASSSGAGSASLSPLVHALCALAEEWFSASAGATAETNALLVGSASRVLSAMAPLPAPYPTSAAAAAASPASPASPLPPLAASTMRQAFISRYTHERMRLLLPPMPFHQDDKGCPPALQLLRHVLTLLRPILPAHLFLQRAHAIRDALRFLCAGDILPRNLLPHLSVQFALLPLWLEHDECVPEPQRLRSEVAVRWLCLLPETPPREEAHRVKAIKHMLVLFISQPWRQAAPPSAASPAATPSAASSSTASANPAEVAALETLEVILFLLCGAPLLAYEPGFPAEHPSSHVSDLLRVIPLHLALALPDRLVPLLTSLKPAQPLLPDATKASASASVAATAGTVVAPVSSSAPSEPTERNLETALLSMLGWGLDERIEPWVSAMLDAVCLASKFHFLRYFALMHASSRILPQLHEARTRMGACALLRKLLMGDAHSSAAFLTCIDGFVQFTRKLTAEVNESAPAADSSSSASPLPLPLLPFLRSYALLLRSLMYSFTGHMEYIPLTGALKELQDAVTRVAPAAESLMPSERDMQEELRLAAWTGVSTAAASSSSSVASSSSFSSYSARPARKHAGKTGLDNLGNSCYLNSVLQSLCMTDAFRRRLLRIERVKLFSFLRAHPVLMNLQSIFGFLLLSHRPSYAPRPFFQSLPLHFRDASQQDAGEFAKFVLDAAAESLKKLGEHQAQAAGTAAASSAAITPASLPAPTAVRAESVPAAALAAPLPLSPDAAAPQPPLAAVTVQARNDSTCAPMDIDGVTEGVKGGSPVLATVLPAASVATADAGTVLLPAATVSTAAAASVSLAPPPLAATASSSTTAAASSTAASSAVSSAAASPTAAAPATPPSASRVSIIEDEYFGGHLLNEITCSVCGTCSSKQEPFIELPLALEIEEAPAAAPAPAAAAPVVSPPSASPSKDAPVPSSVKAATPIDAPASSAPLKPELAAALELAQADADLPLTTADVDRKLEERAGGTSSLSSLAAISALVSSFVPADNNSGPVKSKAETEDDAYMKDVLAQIDRNEDVKAKTDVPVSKSHSDSENNSSGSSMNTSLAPSTSATNDASGAAMVVTCLLTMAAQQMATAAAVLPLAAAASVAQSAPATAAPVSKAEEAASSSPTAAAAVPLPSSPTADAAAAPNSNDAPMAPADAATRVPAAAPVTAPAAAPASAAPSPSPARRDTPAPTHVVPAGPLHLSSMLDYFFKSESLSGSNAFLCATCGIKQTVQKQMRVLAPAPAHLLICLKRNTYTFSNGAVVRNKIMKEVQYPCVLKLPVLELTPPPSSAPCAPPSRRQLYCTYVLYSVIVHSGTSSQRGHYYTICRQSDEEAAAALAPLIKGMSEADRDRESSTGTVDESWEQRARGGRWYQFNDSTVSPSSFELLQQLSGSMPSDVAYLLFYRSLDSLIHPSATHNAAAAVDGAPMDPSVLKVVQMDNQAYMTAMQQAAMLQNHFSSLDKNKPSGSGGDGKPMPDADPDMC